MIIRPLILNVPRMSLKFVLTPCWDCICLGEEATIWLEVYFNFLIICNAELRRFDIELGLGLGELACLFIIPAWRAYFEIFLSD